MLVLTVRLRVRLPPHPKVTLAISNLVSSSVAWRGVSCAMRLEEASGRGGTQPQEPSRHTVAGTEPWRQRAARPRLDTSSGCRCRLGVRRRPRDGHGHDQHIQGARRPPGKWEHGGNYSYWTLRKQVLLRFSVRVPREEPGAPYTVPFPTTPGQDKNSSRRQKTHSRDKKTISGAREIPGASGRGKRNNSRSESPRAPTDTD